MLEFNAVQLIHDIRFSCQITVYDCRVILSNDKVTKN